MVLLTIIGWLISIEVIEIDVETIWTLSLSLSSIFDASNSDDGLSKILPSTDTAVSAPTKNLFGYSLLEIALAFSKAILDV